MALKREFVSSIKNDEVIKDEDIFFQVLAMINEKDINKQIENEETLLHLATWKGYQEVVVELLKKGAHINISDRVGRTAVHLAVKKNDIEILKILLETNYDLYFYNNGLDVFNMRDIDGNTPLMIAQKKGYQEIVKLLNVDSIIAKFKNQISEQISKCQIDEKLQKLIFEKFVSDFDDCYQKLNKEIALLDKKKWKITI